MRYLIAILALFSFAIGLNSEKFVQVMCANTLAITNINAYFRPVDSLTHSTFVSHCLRYVQSPQRTNHSLFRQYFFYTWQHEGMDIAIDLYPISDELENMDFQALTNLGLAAIEAGDYALAIEYLKSVPGVENLLDHKGRQLLEQENPQQALNVYSLMVDLSPDSASSWRGLARAYNGLENTTEAVNAYQQALSKMADDHHSHYELAILLWQANLDTEKAVYHLQMAVALTPESNLMGRRNIFDLIRLQREANLFQQSLDSANLAISRFPNRYEAYFELGQTLQAMDEKDAAINAFQEATRLNPNHAQSYYLMGLTYRQEEDWELALEAFEQALSSRPMQRYYLYWKGRTQEDMLTHCDAIQTYQGLLEYDPAFELAAQRLQQILRTNSLENCND
jgi:tetratricopeptide (TPR) repeat protein